MDLCLSGYETPLSERERKVEELKRAVSDMQQVISGGSLNAEHKAAQYRELKVRQEALSNYLKKHPM